MPKKQLFKPEVEDKLFNFLRNYEEIIQDLINHAEHPEHRRHCQKLKNYSHNIILRRAGLETTTHIFGSRAIGISTPGSDLDLYVHAANENRAPEKSHAIEVLKMVRGTMQHTRIWEVKILIANTKVPLLRVVFLPLDLQLDIVASNPIALYDSDILKHVVDLQPEVKHLFHFILKFVKINDVKIKKMVLFYLTIFYLQRVKVLPTLENVHKGAKKEIVGGWEVQFNKNCKIGSYKLNPMADYECYIIDFFEFYGDFNYADYVIDMFSGKAIHRTNYKIEGFELNTHMCVAAPLDCDRNVARSLGKDTLAKFKKTCKNSAAFLEKHHEFLERREE